MSAHYDIATIGTPVTIASVVELHVLLNSTFYGNLILFFSHKKTMSFLLATLHMSITLEHVRHTFYVNLILFFFIQEDHVISSRNFTHE